MRGSAMREKSYLLVSATIFALVAVLHLARLLGSWAVQVGTVTLPFWGSWLGLIIAATLSVWGLQLAYPRKQQRHA